MATARFTALLRYRDVVAAVLRGRPVRVPAVKHQPEVCIFLSEMWEQLFTSDAPAEAQLAHLGAQLREWDARRAAWHLNLYLYMRDS